MMRLPSARFVLDDLVAPVTMRRRRLDEALALASGVAAAPIGVKETDPGAVVAAAMRRKKTRYTAA